MPIYEYTCKKCDAKFEKLVKRMNDDSKVECPECHSTQTARALSVFAVGAEGPKSSSGGHGAGCGCDAGTSTSTGWAAILAVGLLRRRRWS